MAFILGEKKIGLREGLSPLETWKNITKEVKSMWYRSIPVFINIFLKNEFDIILHGAI